MNQNTFTPNKQFLKHIKAPEGFSRTVLLSVVRDQINTIPPGNYSPVKAREKFTSYVNIALREYNKTAKQKLNINSDELKKYGHIIERKFIFDSLSGKYKSLIFKKYRNK